jgi:hypothetical protein
MYMSSSIILKFQEAAISLQDYVTVIADSVNRSTATLHKQMGTERVLYALLRASRDTLILSQQCRAVVKLLQEPLQLSYERNSGSNRHLQAAFV